MGTEPALAHLLLAFPGLSGSGGHRVSRVVELPLAWAGALRQAGGPWHRGLLFSDGGTLGSQSLPTLGFFLVRGFSYSASHLQVPSTQTPRGLHWRPGALLGAE